MTLVTGTVQDLGHDGMEGTLWARPARFRSDGQVVLAPERKPFKITGGVVSAELAPGPAVLELQVGSHARGTFEVVIPDTDVSLADLLDTVFPWEPAQVSLFVAEREAAEQAKADAEQAATLAGTAKTGAELAAQQTGQDRQAVAQDCTAVEDTRALLDEAYDQSQAGMALPPRLMESELNATYGTKAEVAEKLDEAQADALYTPRRGIDVVLQNRPALNEIADLLTKGWVGSQTVEIACVGDSITEGYRASGADRARESYPAYLVRLLTAAGYPAQHGWVYCTMNTIAGTWDTRWSGLLEHLKLNVTGISHGYRHNNTAAPIVFTSNQPGSEVSYMLSGEYPAHTYTIDGGTPVTVPAGGQAGAVYTIITASGLTDQPHSISIAITTGQLFVFAARCVRAGGVRVTNAGFGGSNTIHWSDPTNFALANSTSGTDKYNPHVVIFGCIVNDVVLEDAAAFKTRYKNALKYWTDRGAKMVLMIPVQPTAGMRDPIQWAAYRQAVYEVATEDDVPLIDFSNSKSTAEATAAGWLDDWVHMTPAGYSALGRAVADTLDAPY